MQLLRNAGKAVIKLISKEIRALDAVLDLAETIGVQNHDAAEAAKEVVVAVRKLKTALKKDEPAEQAAA